MAGIGFKLRDSLNREDYSGLLRAYLFSGLIASGPWIISILAMVLGIALGVVFALGALGITWWYFVRPGAETPC